MLRFQKLGLNKNSLLQAGMREADIEEITVSPKTFLQVMKEQYLDKTHLLQIDTEGFDFEIVRHALKLPFSPPIIHF